MSNTNQTFNIDGQEIPCSLAWRIALRRIYRNQRGSSVPCRGQLLTQRRKGLGPMGARQKVEEVIKKSGVQLHI